MGPVQDRFGINGMKKGEFYFISRIVLSSNCWMDATEQRRQSIVLVHGMSLISKVTNIAMENKSAIVIFDFISQCRIIYALGRKYIQSEIEIVPVLRACALCGGRTYEAQL